MHETTRQVKADRKNSPLRRSPLHDLLAHTAVQWREVDGAIWAWRLGDADREQAALRRLGICDLSPLRKLGCRGPRAVEWLASRHGTLPEKVFATLPLTDGGILARCGAHDFFLESGLQAVDVPNLDAALDRGAPGVARIEQQQATFLLTGERVAELLAQTCALDPAKLAPRELSMTRVAGVSCMLLPETSPVGMRYRIWLDPTLAVALWESLTAICEELGGGPFGVGLVVEGQTL